MLDVLGPALAPSRPWFPSPETQSATLGQEKLFLGALDGLASSPWLEEGLEAWMARHWGVGAGEEARRRAMELAKTASRVGSYGTGAGRVAGMDAGALKHHVENEISRASGLPLASCHAFVSGWAGSATAQSSGGLQRAAARFFDVPLGARLEPFLPALGQPAQSPFYADGEADAFVAAAYSLCQDYLREAGVKELHAFRGMGWERREDAPPGLAGLLYPSGNKEAGTATLSLSPLSSFSAAPQVAWDFARERVAPGVGGDGAFDVPSAVVMAVTIPASRVFSFPGAGLGCLEEAELVLIGGDMECSVFPLRRGKKRAEASAPELAPSLSPRWQWALAGTE